MTTEQIIVKYGQPGPDRLVTITLPYGMRIAWDKKTLVYKMQCHELVADKFLAVFIDIHREYFNGSMENIQRLGIDIFGGCYNFRQMRGGKDWSRHSWGVAIDLDPEKNQLKWGKDRAQFAKPEYKPMIDIFYKHGFISYGVERNNDWMHFEIGS